MQLIIFSGIFIPFVTFWTSLDATKLKFMLKCSLTSLDSILEI